MASLRDLDLKISYSTGRNDLVPDFYSPCMARSSHYWRAVGYFTSSSLSLCAQGIAHLIAKQGQISLIASPALTEEDANSINHGYRNRDDVLAQAARRSFAEVEDHCASERLSALSWLISSGAMDVRLALRLDNQGAISRGIYHEKLGVFVDDQQNLVAFSGSANETSGGLVDNFESIDVYWSWDDPQNRAQQKLNHVKQLWGVPSEAPELPGLRVIDFTAATAELLRRFRVTRPPQRDPLDRNVIAGPTAHPGQPTLPDDVTLRSYQIQLIENWFKRNGRGLMKMATGMGKTITALSIATRLAQKTTLPAVIIICPFKHLVTQWEEECRRFGMSPILAFESRAKWYPRVSDALYSLTVDSTKFSAIITTNATFAGDSFQSQLRYFPRNSLLIADEVHNLGAARMRARLPASIALRLGLSATPERWFDEEGTDELFAYFGASLEPELHLQDGIAFGALCPYRYYPLLVKLTDDEREVYLRLSAQIARAMANDREPADDDVLSALLIKRARLVATATNKLTALRTLMATRRETYHTLFYCGDGRVESPLSHEERRQIDVVCELLGRELGIRVTSYTDEDSASQRVEKRKRFEDRTLQGLVAIRCLDEGVDIPAIETAVILASSSNPRQFIQRRGRVLRPSPGKKIAEIFDMIVVPPSEVCEWESERTMLRKELTRVAEFADLANNRGDARASVLELQKSLDLMDI